MDHTRGAVEVERYDRTWSLYPWQHPAAYWLRANEQAAICTRCGKRFEIETGAHEAEIEARFLAWVGEHLPCPLGDGLVYVNEARFHVHDPLFDEE